MDGQLNYKANIPYLVSNKIMNDTIKLDTSLISTKTIEDEYKEQELIHRAENWLNSKGVETRDDTYEHNLLQSWKILLEFGKYLERSHIIENDE